MMWKPKLPGRLNNMPKMAFLLTTILFYACSSYAIIPAVIPSNYAPVTVPDNCPTTCTIPNGSTLTITSSNATATFSGSITIMPGGRLLILNGARVKMAAGTKIALKGNNATLNGGYLQMDNGHITSTGPNVFWSGIETSVGSPLSLFNPNPAVVSIGGNSGNFSADNLIENAIVGIRNYDSGNPNINATSGGAINVSFTTMRNNIRHVEIYNSLWSGVPVGITQTISVRNDRSMFQYVNFINTANFNPPTAPVDMVYLNNCSNIPLWSCQFHNYNAPAYNTVLKGVNAVNSSFFLQSYPGLSNPQTTYRCAMTGLGTAVVVTNALQTNKVCVVANTDFDSCTYSVNLSGCFKPFVVNTNIHMLQNTAVTQGGIYMDNCTGYTVEANNINAVGIKNIFGILAKNSGTVPNEVYRNAVVRCEVGVEPMGVNRNTAGTAGLTVLCNNLSQVYRSGIYVVPNTPVIPPPNFGIASQQQNIITVGILNALASAANTFRNGSPLTRDFEVFPTSNPVTPYSQIYYRYYPFAAGQKPINTNLLTANVIAATFNSTCPVKATGAKPTPFPFSLFVQNNAAIEKEIREVSTTAIASTDSAEILAYLYTRQSELIDSIIDYYQYMSYSDTTDNDAYTDSIAMVYKEVNTNYEYQVYQASAYRDLGRYEDAITLLGSLAERYQLGVEESQQVAHIADMYEAMHWLQQNDGDWSGLPSTMKDQVNSYEQEDPMFAGAIARSLLAQYEGRSYDPIYMAPPEEEFIPMNYTVKLDNANSIYPNPATNSLQVSYTSDNAVFTLADMTGREVLRQHLNSNRTTINIGKLPAGMYFAAIWSGTTIQYRQKVVKK